MALGCSPRSQLWAKAAESQEVTEEWWDSDSCSRTYSCNTCEHQTSREIKKKNPWQQMLTLKLIPQSTFSQDKELPKVFSFPNHLRARKCETCTKKYSQQGKGAKGRNCLIHWCSLPVTFLTAPPSNTADQHQVWEVTKTYCLDLAEILFTYFWSI